MLLVITGQQGQETRDSVSVGSIRCHQQQPTQSPAWTTGHDTQEDCFRMVGRRITGNIFYITLPSLVHLLHTICGEGKGLPSR